MSITYSDLFDSLGKLIKNYNTAKTDADALDAASLGILEAFQAEDQDLAVDGLASAMNGWKSQYAGRRATLANYMLRRLQDRDSILAEIGAVTTNLDEVLSKFIVKMAADSQSVNASSVSLGSVTAGGSNAGNGTILTTKVLDGVTSPGTVSGAFLRPQPRYKGLDTELCVPSETMRLICTQDSFQDRTNEGSEVFTWTGAPGVDLHGVGTEGSGQVGSVTSLHSYAYLSNTDFESFTSNVPDSWTRDAGVAGTNIYSESTNKYHGTYGLRFKGDGSTASLQISQAPASGTIVANKRYAVTFRYKADATIASGTFTVQFEGTGYSAGSTEKVSIAAGSLATSWTLASFFVNMPANIPSDFKLVIKWTGTPTTNKNLYVDDLAFGPVSYGGGLGVVAVRGSTPTQRNDSWTFTVANTEGVVQKAFRRVFGVQLPSDSGGTETIADSVGT